MSQVHKYTETEREHIEELSASYALGSLTEDEAGLKEFQTLIESGDPLLSETLEQMLGASVTLAAAVPQVIPPPSLRVSLLEQAAKIKQTPDASTIQQDSFDEKKSPIQSQDALRLKKRTRYFIGTSILSGLLLCTLVAMNVSKSAKLDRSNDLMKALLHQTDSLRLLAGGPVTEKLSDSVAAPVAAPATENSDLHRFFAMFGEADARLVTLVSSPLGTTREHLFFSPKQRKVAVIRENLRPLDGNKSYVLWATSGHKDPVAIGTFKVDSKNSPNLFTFSTNLKSANSFAISIEAGSVGATRHGAVIFTGDVPKTGLN